MRRSSVALAVSATRVPSVGPVFQQTRDQLKCPTVTMASNPQAWGLLGYFPHKQKRFTSLIKGFLK